LQGLLAGWCETPTCFTIPDSYSADILSTLVTGQAGGSRRPAWPSETVGAPCLDPGVLVFVQLACDTVKVLHALCDLIGHLGGFEGLKNLPPIHKSHPQTTPPETVEKIRALALEGIPVSAITIQNILHDSGLGTRYDR
jgi:hypothetical protein